MGKDDGWWPSKVRGDAIAQPEGEDGEINFETWWNLPLRVQADH